MTPADHIEVAVVFTRVATRASVSVLEVVAFFLDTTAALGQSSNQAFHEHRLLRAAAAGALHEDGRLVVDPAAARSAGVANIWGWTDNPPASEPRFNRRMRQAPSPLAQRSLFFLPAAAALCVTTEIAGDHQNASPPAVTLTPPASGLSEVGTAPEHREPSVPLPSPVP